MQNEPNLPGGAGRPSALAPPSRLCKTKPISPSRWGQRGVNRAKRTQFHPAGGPVWWPIVQNEPNSSIADFGLRIADCGLGTDLQRDALCGPPSRGPVVQTNPIGWSKPCETKPISRPRRVGEVQGTRGKCAKQSQFRHVARASCPWVRIMGARAYATILVAEIPHHSTVLSFHHAIPMPIVLNEANFTR